MRAPSGRRLAAMAMIVTVAGGLAACASAGSAQTATEPASSPRAAALAAPEVAAPEPTRDASDRDQPDASRATEPAVAVGTGEGTRAPARPSPPAPAPAPAPAPSTPPASEEPSEPVAPPVVEHPVASGGFTTQNGSASFTVPAGWTGTDRSRFDVASFDEPTWINLVDLRGDGAAVRFLESMSVGPIPGAHPGEFGVVDARPLAGSMVAQSFWQRDARGGFVPHVAIVTVQQQAAHGFPAGMIQHVAWPGEGCSTVVAELSGAPGFRSAFASEAEAVAFLRTAPAAAALDVIASVRYTGLDGRTLP